MTPLAASTHMSRGNKAESSFWRNESPRDLSRVTAFMHHACGHFTQKHEPIIPLPEDFLFASTTMLNRKFNFKKNLKSFYLDVKNQTPKAPLRCNCRRNTVGDPARKSKFVQLTARNVFLLMMSMQQT